MKKILFIAVVIASAINTTYGQDDAANKRLNEVLHSYFTIKDALVAGNSQAASAGATAFIKNLNGVSYIIISEGNVNSLLKDAAFISNAKDIGKQRAAFANFSTNMAAVAKALKLSDEPVYLQYCPMKKASWLSNEKAIKNPYYGSSMLTCGKVTDTIQ